MQPINLSISGMSCGHCVAGVRKAIDAVPGATVRDVRVGSADVAIAEGVEVATVISAVRDAGYEAAATAGSVPDAPASSGDCCGMGDSPLIPLRAR